MTKRFKTQVKPNIGQLHTNERRTLTRRELLARGLVSGAGLVVGPSLLGFFGGMRSAYADCVATSPTAMPAFLCFDLAGGGNIAGSNAMVGKTDSANPIRGNQFSALTGPGYNKLGIASGELPTDSPANLVTLMGTEAASTTGDIVFHRKSALLAGIRLAATDATLMKVNGCVLCTRSNDDTQNNPHNPTYGIARVAQGILGGTSPNAKLGSIVTLVGTSSSVSGGNSVAPASQIDAKLRPTKIASGRDAQGLVDSGKLAAQLGSSVNLAVASIEKISGDKRLLLNEAQPISDALNSAYGGASEQIVCNSTLNLDPARDSNFTSIHQAATSKIIDQTTSPLLLATRDGAYKDNAGNPRLSGDIAKTSAVTKLVIDGYAGAGTIQMGSFDYHTGDRIQGDRRDMQAGFAIGTALEYARLMNRPLMIYIYSDGAVSSNGKADTSNNVADVTGKLVWTSDNGSCAATLLLVYNPSAKPVMNTTQLGGYQDNGSVDTKAAAFSNSVQTLSETVISNYLALTGNQGRLNDFLKNNSLPTSSQLDNYLAFNKL